MYEVIYYSDDANNPILDFLLKLSDKDIDLALKRQAKYIKGCDNDES